MPFTVEAFVDDFRLSVRAPTAKEAFAEAVDWHVKRLSGVSIRHGSKSYSVAEFAEIMALKEIADTV